VTQQIVVCYTSNQPAQKIFISAPYVEAMF